MNSTTIIRHGASRGNAIRALLRAAGRRAKRQGRDADARAEERLADGYARLTERYEARRLAAVARY
jgi:hypothetical protein